MSQQELMGIVQVQETSYIDEVNANLETGWKLLLAYTSSASYEFPNDLISIYSLGWPSEMGTPDFIRFEHNNGGWAPDPEILD